MQSISIKWKIVGGQDTGNRWRTCLRNVLETLVGGGYEEAMLQVGREKKI